MSKRPLANQGRVAPEDKQASDVLKSDAPKEMWGRHYDVGFLGGLIAFLGLLFLPWLALGFEATIRLYNGSIWAVGQAIWGYLQNPYFTKEALWWVPPFTARGFAIYGGWIIFQFLLYVLVPGPIGKGQETPAGHVLSYNVNGLRCWVLSHGLLYVASYQLKLFKPSILYDEWPTLLMTAQVFGLTLTVLAYLKAWISPSHPKDCKFSGSLFYDLFMGVELNPRFGDWFDFKLFFNGRPGILAWSIINFSMAAKQYELYGSLTRGMVLVNILHLVYILDFFWNEDWYLRTIDIAHDHFGFYLSWGDLVWLPFTYTLQAYYLAKNPVEISDLTMYIIIALGVVGYYIFRAVNAQKNDFRNHVRDSANVQKPYMIWGRPAKFIACDYQTAGGEMNRSYLLTSGFWGLSRHFNYIGDLMMSLGFCLCCGYEHLLPYYYIIYMTILLVHRVERDCVRLSMKYGEKWNEYCSVVRYKILPGVY